MPSIINASTTLGLISTADTSGVLQLQTANTAALTIDATQNVGIGTASPAYKLDVQTAAGRFQVRDLGGSSLKLMNSTTGGNIGIDSAGGITLIYANGTETSRFDSSGNFMVGTTSPTNPANKNITLNANSTDAAIVLSLSDTRTGQLYVASSEVRLSAVTSVPLTFRTADTERARIDSSGNLLVGTTTASGKLFSSTSSATQPALRAASTSATYNDNVFAIDVDRNTTNNTFYAISYYNNGAAAHKFRVADSGNVTNTNNSYGAISDVKLKENIVDATPKLSALQNVRIVNYNRIGSEEKELGVIAQELEQVFPALVETHIDRDAEGNDLGTTTKSVKYSVFVPMLIKAIQELKADFDAYKASHP